MASDAGAGEPAARRSDPAAPSQPEYFVVGHCSKAHGTKGELFVWPLTDHPDVIFAAGQTLLRGDHEGALLRSAPSVVIEAARPFKRGLLVKLEGYDTREAADSLARQYLLVPADRVAPLDEGEAFYHEMLGMAVRTVAGDNVGAVREVYEAVPSDLLEVVGDDGRVRLVPFADRIVRELDRDRRIIIIDPPEGLLDL